MASAESINPKSTNGKKYVIPNYQDKRSGLAKLRKINNNWQYLNDNNLNNNASTDQIFNASYARRGLQPQNFGTETEPAANDKVYDLEQNNLKQNNNHETSRRGLSEYKNNNLGKNIRKLPAVNKLLSPRSVIAKSRVSANTTAISTWYGNLWLWVQFPLGLLGLVGIAAPIATEESNTAAVADWFLGISDIGIVLFFTGYIIALVIGIASFVMMYLEYNLSLTKSLSGKRDSLKTGTVFISFIGYVTPGLNILPWLFLWVLVVWMYPE